jgi:hypothetical protein
MCTSFFLTRQKIIIIDVNAIDFRVSSFCLIIVNGHQLLRTCDRYSFYFYYKDSWVGDLVCLCVIEDRNCAKKWMVEGAIALKKVCGMDGRR